MTEFTISDVKGFRPPPLTMRPDFAIFLTSPSLACIHPSRNPGARIFENDPREIKGHILLQVHMGGLGSSE